MCRVMGMVAALTLLWPIAAAADPIDLKLSFFTSDQSAIYQASIKPFVDAVNTAGKNLVHVTVYFSGAISPVQSKQPQLVSDGGADLALIVPGQTPDRFPDSEVMELPGLFPNTLAASRVFTRLARDGALTGYGDYFVVGAFLSSPEDIHSRVPVASLADLKNLKVRVNNLTEAGVLQRFGAVPVVLAINQTTDAVSRGTIDAATFPPSILFQFGIGRVTTHHYMIGLGGVPTLLIMNRRKFDSLPPEAQSIIQKCSGDWLADESAKQFDALDADAVKHLEADPLRTVITPNGSDAKTIQTIYAQFRADYADSSDHNRDLLAQVRDQLAKLPATE